MSLLPLLLACTECAPLRGLPVFDPDGLISAEQEADLQAAAAEYAAWTGRDTACVPGIEIVAEDHMEYGGLYRGLGRRIFLREDAAVTSVLRHELTHALDVMEGLVSGRPRALPDRGYDPEWYPSPHAQAEEGLARLSERGPLAATVLAQEVAAACDLPPGPDHAGHVFVQERLWRGWDDRSLRTPGPALDVGATVWSTELEDPFEGWVHRWFAVGDHTVRLQWHQRGGPLDGRPRVVVGDRWTGAVTAVTQWPAPVDDTAGAEVLPDLHLIPGVHEGERVAWLVVGRLQRRAWRLDLESGALTEAPPPLPVWSRSYDALLVYEDRTVLAVDRWLQLVDRETHTALPLGEDVDLSRGIALAVDGDRLRFLSWDGATLTLALESGATTRGPPATPAWQGWSAVAWSPDADRWVVGVDLDDLAVPQRALMTLDPETGAWALPPDPCAGLTPADEFWGLHQGADGPWLVHWGTHDSGRTLQEARPLRVVPD